jgi:hypothetical protein
MVSLLLRWYVQLEVWLFFVSPHFLWQAIQEKRASTLRRLENSQPVYAPFTDCVDRLRDAYMLIISGDATTGQILAVLFVIAVHTAYVGLLMKSVHRRATIRPDTQ